tara:strand:+ start:390 stop:539 length:150 start_codon:yes stop_codon:yes gene_type:complete
MPETFDEFISRVTEMYAHNLVHYPDENPTLDGAFCEVMVDILNTNKEEA